jgi:hypothetical protein
MPAEVLCMTGFSFTQSRAASWAKTGTTIHTGRHASALRARLTWRPV